MKANNRSSPNRANILCVGKESLVLMGDRSAKRIDRVEVGDVVATGSGDGGEMGLAVVEKVAVSVHSDVKRVVFENGDSLDCTPDHPIWVCGKGWCAVDADLAFANYGELCRRLIRGDQCLRGGESGVCRTQVVSIDDLPGVHEMYVVSAGEAHCFFANGILVHDENLAMLSYVGCGSHFIGAAL